MNNHKMTWYRLAGLAGLALALACGQAEVKRSGPWKGVPVKGQKDTVDHTPFFTQEFKTGPEVTKACLKCHKEAGEQMLKSEHWQWLGDEVKIPGHNDKKVRIGKKNVFNNFCLGVQSNWPACTTCHAGYGWKDETFDFKNPNNIDCLVCHDSTGDYRKKGGTGGMPEPDVNLLHVAQKVALPNRANCGTCHFRGGGGNAVKHGDLDNSLMHPNSRLDVHMGKNDMVCTDCHKAKDHQIPGRAISVGVTDENRVSCTDCHDAKPHNDNRLNSHTDRLACQTCHIPYMGDKDGTKMEWYWSQAGDGERAKKVNNKHAYMKIKGKFVWKYGAEPEYYWWNGASSRYMVGDKMDPDGVTKIAYPLGDRQDAKAKIWPFKVHRGDQPFDKQNNIFLIPNLFGPEGYWTKFDWDLALRNGSKVTGQPYSGEYGFAKTEMYWPLSHMVQTKDRALTCRDCHGEGGRMNWQALGFDADPIGIEEFEHDAITLRDSEGNPVQDSAKPLSITATCSECHDLEDADFIKTHGYHQGIDLQQLAPERRALMVNGPRFENDLDKTDCLLCHLHGADNNARLEAIAKGQEAWSGSATLLQTGLLSSTENGYQWQADKFAEDKTVQLPIGPASEENCGACHGQVHNDKSPVFFKLDGHQGATTMATGQVFSGQAVRESGLNLSNKDKRYGPWDVHAQRLVGCGDCHYQNALPERFVREKKTPASKVKPGERRSCTTCHQPANSHSWLPNQGVHFANVSCESCHIPYINAAAAMMEDRTVMHENGQALISYRGLANTAKAEQDLPLMQGYTPALMADEKGVIRPYNIKSEWQWISGEKATPVSTAILRKAWLDGEHYKAEIVGLFDANKDGQVDDVELRLDSTTKVALISKNLAAAGAKDAKISGSVKALALHHNVATGSFARKTCTDCHLVKGKSKLKEREPVAVAPYLPGGVEPVMQAAGAQSTRGTWVKDPSGSLSLRTQLK